MAEEDPEAEVAGEMEFAEIIGAVFEPKVNGISGTLTSTEQYLALVTPEIEEEPERMQQAEVIKKTFLDLNSRHSGTLLDAKIMIDNMVAFKEEGRALAQKIDNRLHMVSGRGKPHSLRKFEQCPETALATMFLEDSQSCTLPQRHELSRRLQQCAREWYDLGDLIRTELVELKTVEGATVKLKEEADLQLARLTTRMIVLTGTIVVLGALTGGAAFAAAPLLAGGFGTLAVLASSFAGLTISAKAVAMRALGKMYTKRKNIQDIIESGESAAEASEGRGARLEALATTVGASEEEAQAWREMVDPVLLPQNRSVASLTELPRWAGQDAAGLIDLLQTVVQDVDWPHKCEVWGQDVRKLGEVASAIRLHEAEEAQLRRALTE